jgi:hypothetical protein
MIVLILLLEMITLPSIMEGEVHCQQGLYNRWLGLKVKHGEPAGSHTGFKSHSQDRGLGIHVEILKHDSRTEKLDP